MVFWILEVPWGSPEQGKRRFSQVWVFCAFGPAVVQRVVP